jgi:hypothetical protein
MKRFNLHFKLHHLKSFLLCLVFFPAWTMHAQNVGIGTTTPGYQLTLGGTNGVFGVENTATFTAKNSSGIYEAYFWPRWNDNRTILNYGTGGLQIRDNASNVKLEILNNGFVGIGTTAPTTTLHVSGNLRVEDGTQAAGKVLTSDANGVASWQTPTAGAETDPQVASTISNCVPKWNGTALTDGLIFDNGTNVGIGTLSPAGKLHVQTSGTSGYAGHIILQAPSMVAGASTVLMSGKNTSTGNQAELRYTYNGDGSTDNRYEFGFSNIQPFVSFTAGQRVGIGTLTPSTKLDVVGQVRIQDGTQAAGKVLTSDASGVASWQTPTAGAETDPQVSSTSTNQIPKWNGTTLTDGLVTDNGTNVGIGTTSPTGKLHVQTSGTSGYAGHIILQAPSMIAGASTVLMSGKNTSTGNQAELRYTYNGDGSTDNRYEFGFSNIQPFVSFTAGERVGIGTLTPSTKLDVVGQVKIKDGTQAAGKVLTSDASGVASWQTPTAGAESDPQVSSATTNQIPKWNGTTLTDGLITDNGTNVGIGTTSPTGKLHVQTTGTSGYAGHIILQAPSMISGASTVLMLGKNTSTGNQAELRYTYNGEGSPDSRYEFGFANIQPNVIINASGRMGIGTFSPGGLLELGSDQGRKPSTSTWTITSDARVKNIEGQYSKGLNEIVQLNPIVYHYKNALNKTFSADVLAQENVGLTAQEVQTVFPEAVGVDTDGTLNLNMHSIFIAQINAIKELNEKVEEQQVQIELLLTKMNELVDQMNHKE